jgi:hypothetical protein
MNFDHLPRFDPLEFGLAGVDVPSEIQVVKISRLDSGDEFDDLMTGYVFGTYLVSERLRGLIEARAIDRCQFVPVEFTVGPKPAAEQKFYMFVMLQLIESIDPARSEVAPSYIDKTLLHYSSSPNAKIRFFRESITGRDIWVDKHSRFDLFISDQMKDEIEDAGMLGICFRNLD